MKTQQNKKAIYYKMYITELFVKEEELKDSSNNEQFNLLLEGLNIPQLFSNNTERRFN